MGTVLFPLGQPEKGPIWVGHCLTSSASSFSSGQAIETRRDFGCGEPRPYLGRSRTAAAAVSAETAAVTPPPSPPPTRLAGCSPGYGLHRHRRRSAAAAISLTARDLGRPPPPAAATAEAGRGGVGRRQRHGGCPAVAVAIARGTRPPSATEAPLPWSHTRGQGLPPALSCAPAQPQPRLSSP